MHGVHNDNSYLRLLALSQSLAQAAAEAGKDRYVDRARAAEDVQKMNESVKEAEKKKVSMKEEPVRDGKQAQNPRYRPGSSEAEPEKTETREKSSRSSTGLGRIDIRI